MAYNIVMQDGDDVPSEPKEGGDTTEGGTPAAEGSEENTGM